MRNYNEIGMIWVRIRIFYFDKYIAIHIIIAYKQIYIVKCFQFAIITKDGHFVIVLPLVRTPPMGV